MYEVVKDRLGELLRVLRSVISKHQALNSEEILSAAGALIAKVKGQHTALCPVLCDVISRINKSKPRPLILHRALNPY